MQTSAVTEYATNSTVLLGFVVKDNKDGNCCENSKGNSDEESGETLK